MSNSSQHSGEKKALVIQDSTGTFSGEVKENGEIAIIDPTSGDASSNSPEAAAIVKERARAAALVQVSTGFDFNLWFLNEAKAPTKKPFYFWYDGPTQIVPRVEVKDDGSIVPATTETGSFYWVEKKSALDAKGQLLDSEARKKLSTVQKLSLNDLTDIFFGKRIQIFAAMAAGSDGSHIAENCCFSLTSHSVTLAGEASTPSQVQQLALVVQHIASQANQKVIINRNLHDPFESKDLKSITIKTRKVLLDKTRYDLEQPVEKSNLLASDDVMAMIKGISLTLYELGAMRQGKKSDRVLYYDFNKGRLGTFIVASPAQFNKEKAGLDAKAQSILAQANLASSTNKGGDGEEKKQDNKMPAPTPAPAAAPKNPLFGMVAMNAQTETVSLPVDELVTIFLGKQSQLLSLPVAISVREDHCLSLVGSTTVVTECKDKAVIPRLIAAVKHLVQYSNKQLVQQPLKDQFQPLKITYAVSVKKPPRDSDDEEDEDGEGDEGGYTVPPGCIGGNSGGG